MACRTVAAPNGRGSPTTRRTVARSRPDSMTGPRTVPPSSADTRPVPSERIRRANDAPVRPERAYVLYWMVAARRARANFALERAVELAVELARPLIVFEPLRVGYPWASDRLHAFVLQGMADNARAFARTAARYFPYVEASAGEGRGLLETLAGNAAAVITDDAPVSFVPRMIAAAAGRARRPRGSGRRQRPASAARGRPRLPDRVLVSRASAEDPPASPRRRSSNASARRHPPAAPAHAGRGAGPLAGGAAGAPHRRRGRARGPADRSRRRAGPGDGVGPRRGRPG